MVFPQPRSKLPNHSGVRQQEPLYTLHGEPQGEENPNGILSNYLQDGKDGEWNAHGLPITFALQRDLQVLPSRDLRYWSKGDNARHKREDRRG
ncbi:hypothetical protein PM082_009418 [Marasmius tenuissimus]|nr:hypothetical protein PM082_009418 [Marasmius tenuissimus]